MRRFLRPIITACFAAFATTGCGSSSSSGSPSAFLPAPTFVQSSAGLAKSQTLLYVAGEDGVHVYTESGRPTQVFAKATGAADVAMDDAGHVYVEYIKNNLANAARYAIGGSKPNAKYIPSTSGDSVGLIDASHKGEFLWVRLHSASSSNTFVFDVWDPGKTGSPSRTFTYPTSTFAFSLDNNGALYVPYYDSSTQTYRYDEIPAGTSKPSRTIVDTIVTGPSAASFFPDGMTALTDGTLYVAEWGLYVGDPFAGLYVYPPHGTEYEVTGGAAAPITPAVDAAGNVYVLNSNYAYNYPSGPWLCDTLHTLSTFSPGAKTLLSQATSGFLNGQQLTVSATGTAFIDEFNYAMPNNNCTPQTGIASVAPRAKSGTQIVGNLTNQDVVLYDGVHATNYSSQALR